MCKSSGANDWRVPFYEMVSYGKPLVENRHGHTLSLSRNCCANRLRCQYLLGELDDPFRWNGCASRWFAPATGRFRPDGSKWDLCGWHHIRRRDVVQRTIGRRWSLLIIVPGAILTALLDVRLAVASASAFLFSESVDFLVYTPLQRRGFVRAVVASGLAAAVVDSLLFLAIAGIPLAVALPGLLLGKCWVMLLAAPVVAFLRARLDYAKTAPVAIGTSTPIQD